jgi:DNA-binding CsgD family transcriptional regulator
MFSISNTIRQTQTPDGAVLLDIARGQMFALNATGSKILDLLGKGYDEAQIAEHLSVVCGTDIDTVRTDVHDFLKTLTRHEILHRSEVERREAKPTHVRTDAT